MNLVLLEPHELAADRVVIDGARAKHIRDVLRAQVGDTIAVGVEYGAIGRAAIVKIEDVDGVTETTLVCTWVEPATSKPPLDLVLALPRPKAFLRMLSPLAQLGVGHIFVTNAYKVERSYFDSHVLDADTMTAELRQGLMQAKHTYRPTLSVHRSFAWMVQNELSGHSDAVRWLVAEPLSEGIDPAPFAQLAMEQRDNPALRTLLFIGPEGGFAPREQRLLLAKSARCVSLGQRTFRSDLATYLLVAKLQEE